MILLYTTAGALIVGRHEGTFHRINVLLVSPVFMLAALGGVKVGI